MNEQTKADIAALERFLSVADDTNDREGDDGDGHTYGFQSRELSDAVGDAMQAFERLRAQWTRQAKEVEHALGWLTGTAGNLRILAVAGEDVTMDADEVRESADAMLRIAADLRRVFG